MIHLENELTELHKRLVRIVLVYLLLLLPLAYHSNTLYSCLAKPLLALLKPHQTLIATEVTAPFMIPLKLSLWVSLALIIPFVLHQFWHFIAPALYAREKKFIKPLICTSIVLFYGGMCFAYTLVCPLALRFFIDAAPEGVMVMTDIRAYLDFILQCLFGFGLGAELPLISFILVRSHIVSAEALQKKRPYVIIGIFVLSMLLTPPDVISQILLALPLWGLFELSLWAAKPRTLSKTCKH